MASRVCAIKVESDSAIPVSDRSHRANAWDIGASKAARDRFLAGDFDKLLVGRALCEAVDVDLHGSHGTVTQGCWYFLGPSRFAPGA
jgi:hypothetical protein